MDLFYLAMFYITNFEKQYLDHSLISVFVIAIILLLFYVQKVFKK